MRIVLGSFEGADSPGGRQAAPAPVPPTAEELNRQLQQSYPSFDWVVVESDAEFRVVVIDQRRRRLGQKIIARDQFPCLLEAHGGLSTAARVLVCELLQELQQSRP